MELDYVKLKPIKPAVSGYIRKSQALLRKSAVPDEKAVHDIRVLMKKSRALLKLIASQPDNIYHKRNIDELKQVGSILRQWRETTVIRKLVKELKKENPKIFSALQESTINEFFRISKSQEEDALENITVYSEQIKGLLDKTSYRLRFQPMDNIDPHLLIKELEDTFNKVIDSYLDCRNNPRVPTLHKFRMRAKDFLYQLWIFRPLNPSVIKTLEKRVNSMVINLGKYNDLAQIIKNSGYKYKKEANLPAMDELVIRIREKQDSYLNKAWVSAYKVFCPGRKLVNLLGFKLLVI
jgi:CHAD domain-containing protein